MIHKDACERRLGMNKLAGIIMSVVGLGTIIVRCMELVNGKINVHTMEGKEDIGMTIISVCLFIFGAYICSTPINIKMIWTKTRNRFAYVSKNVRI